MRLRERDGGRQAANLLVLLQAPRLHEVPPLGAVVEVAEPGLPQGLDLLEAAAESLGNEQDLGAPRLRRVDEAPPERRGNLVGRVTAEAGTAHLEEAQDQALPVPPQRVAVG